ncbi:MAG: glycosyltransferase, partial [Phenylobacterium sp.]|nr:glycosyltransferase [Phenylobacterium sp.]
RTCGVYAMPSANEAIALAALEAMACGAAVVLSRIRAFEQLVTDGVNGRLTPVGDVPALAEAILSAWDMRESLGRAASETIQADYNAKVLYSRLADSLRNVATEGAAG